MNLPGPSEPPQPIGTQPIPAGFRPVAVVECVRVVTSVPEGGIRIAERRQVAVTGLGRVLAALRRPPEPRPRGLVPACVMPAFAVPWFVLIGADGQVIHPNTPLGPCGQPIPPVLTALNSLHWKTLGTTDVGAPVLDITPAITAPRAGARS